MANPSHAELLREYLEQLTQPGADSRLPKWTDWPKQKLGAPMALGATLALVGCGGESTDPSNQGGEAGTGGTSATSSATGGSGAAVSTGGTNPATRYGVVLQSGGTSGSARS